MRSKSLWRVVFAVGVLAFGSHQAAAAQMSRRERIERALNDLGRRVAARQEARPRVAKRLCDPSDTNLCLLGRFIVVAVWDNPYSDPNAVFDAGAIQLTDESGYMWFDSPTNMEIPLKLLDFCQGSSGTFKVFAAGLSDFGVNLGILDQVSGTQVNYINDDKNVFNTIIDESPPWPCP